MHKVSTDALKLLAIREVHPAARLILAFADEAAAGSVSGWKAETLGSQWHRDSHGRPRSRRARHDRSSPDAAEDGQLVICQRRRRPAYPGAQALVGDARSLAIWQIGFSEIRTSSTASRRNSGGNGGLVSGGDVERAPIAQSPIWVPSQIATNRNTIAIPAATTMT